MYWAQVSLQRSMIGSSAAKRRTPMPFQVNVPSCSFRCGGHFMIRSSAAKRRTPRLCPCLWTLVYRAAHFVHDWKLHGEAKNIHLGYTTSCEEVLMSQAACFAAEVRDSSVARSFLCSVVSRFTVEVTFRIAESHFWPFSASVTYFKACIMELPPLLQLNSKPASWDLSPSPLQLSSKPASWNLSPSPLASYIL